MRYIKTKIFMFAVAAVFLLFFSNDFGLIDIEKNAIITAVAVDVTESGEYEATLQIAVPEATDTNTENKKAVITGKGNTVGGAIKNIGTISGWFPKLSFCNLIIIGESVTNENCFNVMDYFAKTLRIQDSALVILAEKSAKELIETASPLDNISSFALQKILLKNPGFDVDVAPNDIKTFSTGYYSESASSFMPLVKIKKQSADSGDGSQGSGGSTGNGGAADKAGNSIGSGNKGNILFDATTTALFYKGMKVGELDKELTLVFNLLTRPSTLTTYQVNDVNPLHAGENYLMTVLRNTPSIKLSVNENTLDVNVNLDIYCKISDQNSQSDTVYSENVTLPPMLREKMQNQLKSQITELIDIVKATKSDILKIKQKLYRLHYKHYGRYKDNYLDVMNVNVNVKVSGQK